MVEDLSAPAPDARSLVLTRGSGPARAMMSAAMILAALRLPKLGGAAAAMPAGTSTWSTEERAWKKTSCAGLRLSLLRCRSELHLAS